MTNDFDNTKPYILQVIEHQTGLKLKKIGNQYNLNPCPFCKHNDCFFVKSDNNDHFFKCQSCGEGGTVHDFIQKQTSLSLSEGLKLISDITGYQLQSTPNSTPKHKSNNIHEVIAKYYHQVFLKDAEKQKYQLQVRCHDLETIKKQMIGVADGRLHIHLEKEGFTESEMLDSGFISKENGALKDKYYPGVTVYPQTDINGNVGHFRFRNERNNKKFQLSNNFKNPEIIFYNMPAFKQDNIYLKEGEHDAMSLMDIGINNTVATNGQLTEKQLYYIKDWLKSERQKEITLIFDNDDAGKGYTKKFIAEVQSKCFVDLLKSELRQQNLILKIITLDKCKDIDEYLVKKGGTDTKKKKKLFEALEAKARRYLMSLKDNIKLYENIIEEKNKNVEPGNKVKPNNVFKGKFIAEYFNIVGTFIKEPANDFRCSVILDGQIYPISDNVPFNALLNRIAGLNASQNGFKVIRQEIIDYAFNDGKSIVVSGCISAIISKSHIYFNMCNEQNELIKLSPGNIEFVENGSNEADVLLLKAPRMASITYLNDASIDEAMHLIKILIFENLPCSETNKFYMICISICSFFVNFINARGLLKLSGNSGSGKTTASKLLSTLLFGENMTTTGTTASYYTEAANSIMLFIDNVERENMNRALLDFFLHLATGQGKQKRDKNNQTGNVYERLLAIGLYTGIDPPEKEELIQRIIEVVFKKTYWKAGFSETETFETIKEKRDLMLSGIFKLIAYKILPDFYEKRKKAMIWIEKNHKGHAKERLNELLSTLAVILKEVCQYIPYSERIEGKKDHIVILEKWIQQQDRIAKNISKNTNEILRFLNYLLDGYIYHQEDFENNFPNIVVKPVMEAFDNEYKEVSFDYTTFDLLNFFEQEAKVRGIKCSFGSSEGLSARIRTSKDILEAENWTYKSKLNESGAKPKEKRNNRGHRIYRLIKTFNTEGF